MSNLNEMFAENTATQSTIGARSLAGTAQLTNLATEIAGRILTVAANDPDAYRDQVSASKTDHSAMDAFINDVCNLAEENIIFLQMLPGTELEGMLKSQQSKRSRTKGKLMTMDNYRTLMIGAVAENLIRLALGKAKQAGGGKIAGSVSYTAEELAELEFDQDKLRKALRNVQSKKSIMKSKEGFAETDERWLELLEAEELLKSLRADVVKVDETKNQLVELLQGVDISALTKAQAHELLGKINILTVSAAPIVSVDAQDLQLDVAE